MLLGQLPDLRGTRSGKDLIEIGRNEGLREGIREGKQEGLREGQLRGKMEGELRGKIEGLLMLLKGRFNHVEPELRQRIEAITSSEELSHLYLLALKVSSTEEFSRNWPA